MSKYTTGSIADQEDEALATLKQIEDRQETYLEQQKRLAKFIDTHILEPAELESRFANYGRDLPLGASLRMENEKFLRRNPEQRQWVRSAAIVLGHAPRSAWRESDVDFASRLSRRALGTGDSSLGQAAAVDEKLSEFFTVQLLRFSAFRTMGVVPMDGGKRKIVTVKGKAEAYWHKPELQGQEPLKTTTIAGASVSPEVATVIANIDVSGEVLADGKLVFESALLAAIIEGLGFRIDWTCFQGNGADDLASSGMTGIFIDSTVPAVTATGKTSVQQLGSDNFADLIGGVAPSALAYPCRFWIAPDFLPKLLKVRVSSGEGSELLLKPPTVPGGDWTIHGFPVTWASAAPNINAEGAKVAAFGREDAYLIGLRQDFEIGSSGLGAGFLHNLYNFRAIARARCQMRDATSLATLKLDVSGE